MIRRRLQAGRADSSPPFSPIEESQTKIIYEQLQILRVPHFIPLSS